MATKKKAAPKKPTKRSAAQAESKPRTAKVAKKARATPKAPQRSATPQLPPIVHPIESITFARSLIRDVPNFPMPGIVFKDITPLLANPRAFHIVLDALAERFIGEHIEAVVGVEARGFIFGGALAARLNASFVPARKVGKLPSESERVRYETEYSVTELEMHKGSIPEGANVIVVDDVLATGGTALAAAELVRRQGAYVVAYAFALELSFLHGREKLLPVRVESVIGY